MHARMTIVSSWGGCESERETEQRWTLTKSSKARKPRSGSDEASSMTRETTSWMSYNKRPAPAYPLAQPFLPSFQTRMDSTVTYILTLDQRVVVLRGPLQYQVQIRPQVLAGDPAVAVKVVDAEGT